MVGSFARRLRKTAWWTGAATGFALALALVVGYAVGVGQNPGGQFPFPETALHATATDSGETLAIATGPIDEESEGLFTLDFLTGDLRCQVIYTRGNAAQKFGAIFTANVPRDLNIDKEKKPNYLMVTGQTRFLRGTGNVRPGYCVCYVCDANTGKFVAYGVPWNSTNAARGTPQQGQLIPLDVGMARTAIIRDE